MRARAARLRTAAVIIRAARQIKGGAAVFEEAEDSAVFEASWRRAAKGGRRSHSVFTWQQGQEFSHDASAPQRFRSRGEECFLFLGETNPAKILSALK